MARRDEIPAARVIHSVLSVIAAVDLAGRRRPQSSPPRQASRSPRPPSSAWERRRVDRLYLQGAFRTGVLPAGEPQKSEPPGSKRKAAVMMVTHRPQEHVSDVVSLDEGYRFKEGRDASLDIDGAKFDLFTKVDTAWSRTADLDKAIVAAMAKGSRVAIEGTPQKATDHRHLRARRVQPGPGAERQGLRDHALAAVVPAPYSARVMTALGPSAAPRNLAGLGRAGARRRDALLRRRAVPRSAVVALDLSSRRHRFRQMTSLSKAFRDRLADHYELRRPVVSHASSPGDGTRKWLLRFADGQEVETVHIPEPDRGTLCVSSQVGCTLTCRFCHTGTQLLVRNLAPEEIVGQVMIARDALGAWPSPRARGRSPTSC